MFPSESLNKAAESIAAVKGGIADITWTSLSYFPGQFPLTSVMELPFLSLPSGKVDGRPLSGGGVVSHISQELYDTIPEMRAEWSGVKLLFFHNNDPAWLYTKNKPVKNMKDLQGLKVRDTGAYRVQMWKLVGASPIAMPMPDVYDAADKGVIEGSVGGFSGIGTFRHYEVFNTWIDLPGMVPSQFGVMMNLDKWNSLPPDIQQAILSVSGMWGAEFAGENGFGADTRDEVLETAKKAGKPMQGVHFDEADKFKELASKPVWDKWVADANAKGLPGQKVLDAAIRLIEKYK